MSRYYIILSAPIQIDNIFLDPNQAITLALENAYIKSKNRLLIREAETEIERTNRDNGLELAINFSLGLNKTDEEFSNLYNQFLDRQTLSIGMRVPLNGNPERELLREVAAEQLSREKLTIQQEQLELSRQVFLSIQEYQVLSNAISLNESRKDVSQKVFELTLEQYKKGIKNITELNIARSQRDQSILNFYQSILLTKAKYYEIRKLCLYDFLNKKSLIQQ